VLPLPDFPNQDKRRYRLDGVMYYAGVAGLAEATEDFRLMHSRLPEPSARAADR
jgi:hypothetical protein